MRKFSLTQLMFMAICCDLGLFSKRLILPVANLITDSLHIPGGIGTSFSLMFVLVGAVICNMTGSATLMCVVQSGIAFAIGMTGSMGALAPIGYIMPGIVMDGSLLFFQRINAGMGEKMAVTNALASVTAAATANIIVFRLWGPPLWLYLAVAFSCGIIFGLLGCDLVKRLLPQIKFEKRKKEIR